MDDKILVDEAVELLPRIGKLLYTTKASNSALAGLSQAQMRAVGYLYHRGQSTVGELAHEIGLSMPTVSELVDRLVEDGWAERRTNPADRRQVLVGLTSGAILCGQQMHDRRRAQIQAALDRLSGDDRPAFVRSLRALADALQESANEQIVGAPTASPSR